MNRAMSDMQWSQPTLPLNGGPPTIKNHTVTYHDGLLYCFGGYDGSVNHMTLMVYSLERQCWNKVHGEGQRQRSNVSTSASASITDDTANHPSSSSSSPTSSLSSLEYDYEVTGNPPPGRNGHTATIATRHITGRGNVTCIFIIGGWLGAGPLAASDMHILDITDVHPPPSTNHNHNNHNHNQHNRGTATAHWIPIHPRTIRGPSPGPCNMHSADFIPSRKEIYLFRGGNGREYLNDLHAFHVETFTWRVVESRGEIPMRRANHSSAFLVGREELFIFGGWNGKERLNDIHILDTTTSTWSEPHIGGVLPHPRAGMTLTAVRDRLYLFGGSGTSSKCFHDLHILDRKDMVWVDVMHTSELNDGSSSSQSAESHARKVSAATNYTSENNSGNANSNTNNNDSNSNNNNNNSDARDRKQKDPTSWTHTKHHHHHQQPICTNASANPNETESTPPLLLAGTTPGRRAGHTATAVHDRHIYIFGGSCGQDYLNDFFQLDTDPIHLPTTNTQPTSLQLLGGRLKYYCNRGGDCEGEEEEEDTFADVCFVVEGRKVYGHRMVLSLVSDCYRAMFSKKRGGGGFKESGTGGCTEIEVPNCSYDAFLMMMEYIYSGEEPTIELPSLQVGSVDNGDSNSSISSSCKNTNSNNLTRVIEKIVDLLQLADQYFLDHLKQICERKLQPTVNSETVECLLQVAQKSNAKQLESACQHFIRNRVELSLHNQRHDG